MKVPNKKTYTSDEFFTLTEGSNERLELLEGEIVPMASTNIIHQRIIGEVFGEAMNYSQTT